MIHYTPVKASIMKASMFLFSILLLANACKPSEPAAAEGTGDLTGFKIEAIPGSATQRAIHQSESGIRIAEGYLSDNQKTGQWLEYYPEGDIMVIENYDHGVREGWHFKLATRGQIETKALYHQGQLNGNWIQYKFGKIIEERHYNMGKLDGVVKKYDEKTWKLKQEAQYKDGLQDGFFRYYDEEGNVSLEYEYKNGEKVSGGIVEKK